jgi:predicted nucleic acid-binding protein
VGRLTVLDAYPLVAYLVDEPAAEEVKVLLATGDTLASSVNIAETLDVACRIYGASEPAMRGAVELLVQSSLLAISAPDLETSERAAELRIAHYRRRHRSLSLADCFLLAAAGPGDRVATADPAVAEVARREGIDVIALPDSSGRRP